MHFQLQTTCRWISMFCLPAARPLMVNSTGLRELPLPFHFIFQIGSFGRWKCIQLLCRLSERISQPDVLQKSANDLRPSPERTTASISPSPFLSHEYGMCSWRRGSSGFHGSFWMHMSGCYSSPGCFDLHRCHLILL